ncbi:endothelin-converting enzyme homolog [Orbicella faveolata]|uniref:endothelin-converting enzyme homolog n=1 Tax=Orbicella faveolata TaxID=48498 RepID=UPI0009E41D3A|nr:endothelin-converting enzyme homolog [Orbicella faveolata]
MDETKTCEDHKARRRTTSVLLEVKETKRCSTLVKPLILAIALLIICCLILLNLYLIERSRPKAAAADKRVESPSRSPAPEKYYGGSCWTAECLHAASDLMNSVDPSVDPCEDFYRFACGGWMKKYPRPPSSNRWDQFEKLTTENNEVIEMLLRDKELKAIYSKEEAVWKALAYYDSCMDVDEIERLKGEPLKKLIKEYGSWSITDKNWEEKDWDFVSKLARIHKDLVSPILFSMAVVIDNKNSSQNAITFGESYTSLSRRELLTNDSESLRVREAYKGLMRNLTRKLGATEASEVQLLEIFQFEKELAKISTPRFKMPTFEQAYKKLALSELQNYTGNFVNWTRYVGVMMKDNSFQVNSQTKVVVYSLEYLRRLVKLLSKTPKRTVANYLMWRVVKSKFLQLSSDFIEIFKSYYLQAFNYWSDSDQHQLCLMTTSHKFGIPLSKVFLDQKFYGDSKKLAMDIIEDIRAAFTSNIGEVKWMDDETREAARRKAEALIENVGYPDYIVDTEYMARKYKGVKIDAKTYFDNDIAVSKSMNLDKLAKAGTVVDKTEWPFPPTMLNAFYAYNENKMVFPAAILQPPFYNLQYPRAMNYGAIGGVMAHEITHGFDDTGKLYDSEGNRRKWWSNSTLKNFKERSRCLVDQYSNYTFHGYQVTQLLFLYLSPESLSSGVLCAPAS